MAGIIRSASVRLDAIVSPYMAGLSKASVATTAFARNTSAQMSATTAKTTKLGQTAGFLPAKFAGMAAVGGAAFAGIGLAAVAAVKRFADFDVAMDAVGASTGATGAELDQLGDAALDAAKATKFGAVDAARGIEALAKAGISTADIVGGALAGALDLAAAGEIEVADAAEVAASAMTQFKLSGRDVPHIADLIAAAAGKAQGDVSDMSQALSQAGLVASQVGLTLEETTGTLAAFASAGLVGSDAGTSMRAMLLRLSNPLGKASDEMDRLGISAFDARGNFVGMEALAGNLQDSLTGLTQEQRSASLAIIFGQDAIRGANVLYEEGAGGIGRWEAAVNDAGYAAEQARRRTDNLRGDIERLMGELETLLITGGSTGEGPLRGLIQGGEDWIATLNEEIEIWETRYLPTIADVDFAIDKIAKAFGIDLPEGLLTSSAEMENLTDKQAMLNTEVLRDHAAMERYQSGLRTTADASGALAEMTDELRQEASDLADQFLGGRDAARNWEQSIDDAAESLKENGRTLDINTQKGRDNEEALDNMAAAALGLLEDMNAAGEDTTEASAQMREALIKTGRRFDMTEAEAEDYADQVIATARLKINTPVAVNDTRAKEKLAAWRKAVREGGGTITFSIRAIEAAGGLGGFMTSGSSRPGGMPFMGRYRITQGPHDGGAIDYGMPVGTPLRATFPGYLDNTNLGNRSYGMYYTLRGAGKYELGAHLSRFARGDGFISTGSLIGWSGNTGNSTGPHLHLLRNFHTGGMSPGGPINTLRGEYVMNTGASSTYHGLLQAMNAGRTVGGAQIVVHNQISSLEAQIPMLRTVMEQVGVATARGVMAEYEARQRRGGRT